MRKLKKLRLSKDLPGVNLYRKDKLSFVFRKVGLTPERVKTDPAFALTLSKAAAFARASSIAGQLYKMLRPLLSPWLVKTGYRRLLVCILSGMEKESAAPFPPSMEYPLCRFTYDRQQGLISVCIPPFRLAGDLDAPIGATHYKRSLLLATVSMDTGHMQTSLTQDEILYRVGRYGKKGLDTALQPTNTGASLLLAIVVIQYFGPCRDGILSFNHQKSDTMYVMACVKGCFHH